LAKVDFAKSRVFERLDGEFGGKNRRRLLRSFQVAREQETRRAAGPRCGKLLRRAETRRLQRRVGLAQTQSGRSFDIAVADEDQVHCVDSR